MNRIIIADRRPDYLADLLTRQVLEDKDVVILATPDTLDGIETVLSAYSNADFLVVCANLLTDRSLNFPHVVTVVYGQDDQDKALAIESGFPYIGSFKNTSALLNMLERMESANFFSHSAQKTEKGQSNERTSQNPAAGNQNAPTHKPAERQSNQQRSGQNTQRNRQNNRSRSRNKKPQHKDNRRNEAERVINESSKANVQESTEEVRQKKEITGETVKESSHVIEHASMEAFLQSKEEAAKAALMPEIEKEIHPYDDTLTKTVAVYSAKGGVGKTTLASELSTYLSLLPHGRGTYRVCVVDYNIDFGNVRTTLGLSDKGTNMSLWAADIRDRVVEARRKNTEAPLDYSQDEVESFLRKVPGKNIELYALLAPVAHEDSMDIGEVELVTMLKNIVVNGGFDFVICDTGNNTRDSSIIALEMAQYVLLVVTQDVTTTDCNDTFLRTMRNLDFDDRKVKLVINMLSNGTGVSCEEIEEYLNYECIARFNYDTTVRLSNNKGVPLANSPKHKFTKEMQKVVDYLLDGEQKAYAKKRGFFARAFGKRS